MKTGEFKDFRLPPLERLPANERRPVPEPQKHPERGYKKKVKYFSKLASDLQSGAREGRSTKLWREFEAQGAARAIPASSGRHSDYESRRFPKAASWLTYTAPDVSAGASSRANSRARARSPTSPERPPTEPWAGYRR